MSTLNFHLNAGIPKGAICYFSGFAKANYSHTVSIFELDDDGSKITPAVAVVSNPGNNESGHVLTGKNQFWTAGHEQKSDKISYMVSVDQGTAVSKNMQPHQTSSALNYYDPTKGANGKPIGSKDLGGTILFGVEDDTTVDTDFNDVFGSIIFTAPQG